MYPKQYFKRSDYDRLWSKAFTKRITLRKVTDNYVKIINSLAGHCLLDIGVVEGRFILPCVRAGLKYYVSLDVSKGMLLRANKNAGGETPVNLVQGDAECLPFQDEVFDKVICVATSWYLPNLKSLVSEASRVLKRGDVFFGDFMNSSNRGVYLHHVGRVMVNGIPRYIRRLCILALYAVKPLARHTIMRYGFDKDWLTSYFTWGLAPFLPAPFSNVVSLFQLHGFKLKKVVGDKDSPLIIIMALKGGYKAQGDRTDEAA